MRLFPLCAALAIGLAGIAAAQAPLSLPGRLTVTGVGQVPSAPDMATITLGVTATDKVAAQAMAKTSNATEAVLTRLSRAGIAAADVQTSGLSLSPVWTSSGSISGGGQRIDGFEARNTLRVRVRELDGLGEVLDAVIQAGANTFHGLSFGLQNPDPVADEARRRAVADALSKAKLFADAAGVTLGAVLEINESGNPRPMAMEMAAASRGGGVPVAAGEVTTEASVTMVFSLGD